MRAQAEEAYKTAYVQRLAAMHARVEAISANTHELPSQYTEDSREQFEKAQQERWKLLRDRQARAWNTLVQQNKQSVTAMSSQHQLQHPQAPGAGQQKVNNVGWEHWAWRDHSDEPGFGEDDNLAWSRWNNGRWEVERSHNGFP